MIDDMIRLIEAATGASERWHELGWPATFGPRGVEVSSLAEAEALQRNVVYREEAVNYWRQARLIGADTARSGRQAIEALKAGRLDTACDALYLCQYLEKPFEGHRAMTWEPVFEAFRTSLLSRIS